MSNKSKANRFCPLMDMGPPKGDVWVVTKKAVLPYHIEEMGTGAEGLMNLKHAQAKVEYSRPRESNRRRAVTAFQDGCGTLLDEIRRDPVIDIHTSLQDLERQQTLFPPESPKTRVQTLWQSFKRACKDVWDGAQERD